MHAETEQRPFIASPSPPALRHIPLYRWWRRSVVDTVDHNQVIARIVDDSGPTARYLFMTMMSAGIAVLGLLLSSPAVVIGAMLISPLMGPILGIGFGLALFDFAELRRSLGAFALGSIVAVAFAALIVLASPLQAATSEIMARTRPNLFDLLVALFAALAGTFAIIRGRGETIVGVAIATALMPPLAVVGYGLATRNLPVFSGSLALFGTNFVTIALAATIMARLYGFGHQLSSKQTMMQSVVLFLAFAAMATPLALALSQIAREALFVSQVRSELSNHFGPDSRVTQLEVDFHRTPWEVRSVVVAPRSMATSAAALRDELARELGRPISLQLNQILVDPSEGAQGERDALARANEAALNGNDKGREIAALLSLVAGAPLDRVTIDRGNHRAIVAAGTLPGADLATYYELERRIAAGAEGWTVEVIPPATSLPAIEFANGSNLDQGASQSATLSAWAARRWNITALVVPGLTEEGVEEEMALSARRARAIADILEGQGIRAVPGPPSGSSIRLAPPEPTQ